MKWVFVAATLCLVVAILLIWPGAIHDCEERGGTFFKGGCHGAP